MLHMIYEKIFLHMYGKWYMEHDICQTYMVWYLIYYVYMYGLWYMSCLYMEVYYWYYLYVRTYIYIIYHRPFGLKHPSYSELHGPTNQTGDSYVPWHCQICSVQVRRKSICIFASRSDPSGQRATKQSTDDSTDEQSKQCITRYVHQFSVHQWAVPAVHQWAKIPTTRVSCNNWQGIVQQNQLQAEEYSHAWSGARALNFYQFLLVLHVFVVSILVLWVLLVLCN